MQNLNSALRRYYRTIRSYLPCSHKLKRNILNEIQGNVDAYLIEFPDADIAQIEARFGTPQAIAAAYVDDMDTKELLSSMYIRKRIVRTVSTAVLIILAMWGIVVGLAYIDARDTANGTTQTVVNEGYYWGN